MLLKDVKVDGVYAVLSWGRLRHKSVAEFDARDFEAVADRAMPAVALEVGVQVGGYARPGVRLRLLDRHTMQPLAPHEDGQEYREIKARAVQLVCGWDELRDAYHDWLEEHEREQIEQAERREQAKARAQERAAREWMERVFAQAKQDIEQVSAVFGGGLGATDVNVKRLVELRHPNGNPYLNGERTAHA